MNLRISDCGAVLGPECIPAGTLISVRGTTGRMSPDCPNCKVWEGDKSARPTTFRMNDGVTHCAPDMWLAGEIGLVQ